MVSPPTHAVQEARDAGEQRQRGPCPPRPYAAGRPLVGRLPSEHAPRRRPHAGTWGHGEPATSQRWVSQASPPREAAVPRRPRPGWRRGRLDATARRGQGAWPSWSRAGDQDGATRDVLRPEPRAQDAAVRFLTQALRRNGRPATRTLDGSDAKDAASKRSTAAPGPRARRQGQ